MDIILGRALLNYGHPLWLRRGLFVVLKSYCVWVDILPCLWADRNIFHVQRFILLLHIKILFLGRSWLMGRVLAEVLHSVKVWIALRNLVFIRVNRDLEFFEDTLWRVDVDISTLINFMDIEWDSVLIKGGLNFVRALSPIHLNRLILSVERLINVLVPVEAPVWGVGHNPHRFPSNFVW